MSSQYSTRHATDADAAHRCPYAGVQFTKGDHLAVCSVCGALHLEESWAENGGCTTYGCVNAPDFRKDTTRLRVAPAPAPTAQSAWTPSPQQPASPVPSVPQSRTSEGAARIDTSPRSIAALSGFVSGIVSIAAPSYWAAIIALMISVVAVAMNSAARDKHGTTLSGLGIGSAIVGMVIATIVRAL